MKHRTERLNHLIREELSQLILRDFDFDFDSALITLTEVVITTDLNRATVKFSVLPSSKAENILHLLNKNAPHLRHLLSRKIKIRKMPEIFFEIDTGLEAASQIEKILLEGKIKK